MKCAEQKSIKAEKIKELGYLWRVRVVTPEFSEADLLIDPKAVSFYEKHII